MVLQLLPRHDELHTCAHLVFRTLLEQLDKLIGFDM